MKAIFTVFLILWLLAQASWAQSGYSAQYDSSQYQAVLINISAYKQKLADTHNSIRAEFCEELKPEFVCGGYLPSLQSFYVLSANKPDMLEKTQAIFKARFPMVAFKTISIPRLDQLLNLDFPPDPTPKPGPKN